MISRFPSASTRIRSPGSITVVESSCSTIAGPTISTPTPSPSRRYTGVSRQPPSNQTRRWPSGPLLPAYRPINPTSVTGRPRPVARRRREGDAPVKDLPTIGWIGTGVMGAAMAGHERA